MRLGRDAAANNAAASNTTGKTLEAVACAYLIQIITRLQRIKG
jgi:hypothetical protein